MKLEKVRISEAIEDLGDIEYEDYSTDKITLPEDVMPTSFVGALKEVKKQREDANKVIKERRKIALDATESAPEDRFKHMTDKEEAFNKGEKISLDESIFESVTETKPLTEAIDADAEISDLSEYKPWSGAVKTYELIEDAGKLDEFNDIVQELYPDKITKQTINDLLWYDSDFIKEVLDIKALEEE